MLDYRLYFMDEADHIQGVVEFDCIDDAAAIALAESHSDGRAMELWRHDRSVRRFAGRAPGDAGVATRKASEPQPRG